MMQRLSVLTIALQLCQLANMGHAMHEEQAAHY